MFAIACRWVGDDFVVTVPDLLPRWRQWPKGWTGLTLFIRYWRRSTYGHCVKALMEFSGIQGLEFEHTSGRIRGLRERLESMEIVRLSPRGQKLLDPDSLHHWPHHLRDGMQDVYAGYVLQKDLRFKWLGQEVDNEAHPLYRCVTYREVQEADWYGHQLVFRFRGVEIIK